MMAKRRKPTIGFGVLPVIFLGTASIYALEEKEAKNGALNITFCRRTRKKVRSSVRIWLHLQIVTIEIYTLTLERNMFTLDF